MTRKDASNRHEFSLDLCLLTEACQIPLVQTWLAFEAASKAWKKQMIYHLDWDLCLGTALRLGSFDWQLGSGKKGDGGLNEWVSEEMG